MECFNNYVGLRGCGTSTPPSGLYVNDLPGISLKQVVSLTNEEEASWLDLWNMVQRRVQSRFSLDVREAMGKYYKLNSLAQGINLGNMIGSAAPTPAFQWQGFSVEMVEDGDYEYVPSPLASIHVQELRFYAADMAPAAMDFKVYDLYTFQELFTYNLTPLTGWNTIPVNKTFHNNYSVNSWGIFCAYDGSAVSDYVPMDIPIYHNTPNCCDVRIRGANSTANVVSFTSDTYGLSGTFSMVCNWDAIACQNKTIFARAYWYLLGIELLTEQLYSTKLNQFTTVNLQRANELRTEFQVEYMKALDQVAGGFKLNCDCCIECSGSIQLRETTSFW